MKPPSCCLCSALDLYVFCSLIRARSYHGKILPFCCILLSLRLCQTQLNLDQFKQHIKKLKDLIDTDQVKILNYAEQDNAVFTKHLVSSTLKDGSKHTYKVFAEFIVKDGKISPYWAVFISCQVLFLTKGHLMFNFYCNFTIKIFNTCFGFQKAMSFTNI